MLPPSSELVTRSMVRSHSMSHRSSRRRTPFAPSRSDKIQFRIEEVNELMPPPKQKRPLSEDEIVLLKAWIEQGAPYAGHWAFQSITRPAVPETKLDTDYPVGSKNSNEPFATVFSAVAGGYRR